MEALGGGHERGFGDSCTDELVAVTGIGGTGRARRVVERASAFGQPGSGRVVVGGGAEYPDLVQRVEPVGIETDGEGIVGHPPGQGDRLVMALIEHDRLARLQVSEGVVRGRARPRHGGRFEEATAGTR